MGSGGKGSYRPASINPCPPVLAQCMANTFFPFTSFCLMAPESSISLNPDEQHPVENIFSPFKYTSALSSYLTRNRKSFVTSCWSKVLRIQMSLLIHKVC